jgi:predicted metal-binding membrane protein
MVERRVTLGTIAALVGLAAVAWVLTAQQALSMSDMVTGLAQVGTRMPNPMTAPVFMLMWLTMMIAMMFPTIAPMVVAHRLVVVHRGEGPPSLAFVLGYIAVTRSASFRWRSSWPFAICPTKRRSCHCCRESRAQSWLWLVSTSSHRGRDCVCARVARHSVSS